MGETKGKRKKKGKRGRAQTLRSKSATPKGRRATTMGSPKDDAPDLFPNASVGGRGHGRRSSVQADASERTKKRRQSSKKKGSAKRSKSRTAKPQKTESQMRIEVSGDEPDLQKRTTWRSDEHVRKAALKKAHNKSSFRYDEALPVENERMSLIMGMFNDIETTKADRKKKAKLEKGHSLLGEELKAVEDGSMIDVVHEYTQKNKEKKAVCKPTEIDRTFHMIMNDDDEDSLHSDDDFNNEVNLNSSLTDDSSEKDLKGPSADFMDQLMKMGYSEEEIIAAYQGVVDKDDINAIVDAMDSKRNAL